MSCHHLAALLALVGLAFELVAVFLILRSVGVGDPLVRWIKSVRGRLITRIRRLLPWLRNPETIYRDHGVVGEIDLAGEGRATKGRDKKEPPPRSWEEIGERLNLIAADLNWLDRKIDEREDSARTHVGREIGKVRAEAAARHDRLGEEVAEQARKAVSQRKSEGVLFMVGVALQVGGAAVALFVC